MNQLIKHIVESKFDFTLDDIDIEDNSDFNLSRSKSVDNSAQYMILNTFVRDKVFWPNLSEDRFKNIRYEFVKDNFLKVYGQSILYENERCLYQVMIKGNDLYFAFDRRTDTTFDYTVSEDPAIYGYPELLNNYNKRMNGHLNFHTMIVTEQIFSRGYACISFNLRKFHELKNIMPDHMYCCANNLNKEENIFVNNSPIIEDMMCLIYDSDKFRKEIFITTKQENEVNEVLEYIKSNGWNKYMLDLPKTTNDYDKREMVRRYYSIPGINASKNVLESLEIDVGLISSPKASAFIVDVIQKIKNIVIAKYNGEKTDQDTRFKYENVVRKALLSTYYINLPDKDQITVGMFLFAILSVYNGVPYYKSIIKKSIEKRCVGTCMEHYMFNPIFCPSVIIDYLRKIAPNIDEMLDQIEYVYQYVNDHFNGY